MTKVGSCTYNSFKTYKIKEWKREHFYVGKFKFWVQTTKPQKFLFLENYKYRRSSYGNDVGAKEGPAFVKT